jgi:NAD(P)H-hydrate epimerase
MARHLDNAGVRVHVLLFGDPAQLSGDAAINHRILAASGIPLDLFAGPSLDEERLRRQLADAGWIVDALFGSGLRGTIQPPFDRIIAAINAAGRRVFAVDIPSGLDCDTGQPLGVAIRADHTATVAAMKKGFLEPSAASWTGQVHLIDMGAPRALFA